MQCLSLEVKQAKADNYTGRQILLQIFESMMLRVEDVGKDITTFQKVLQYAGSLVNFVVKPTIHMLPSDMDFHVGNLY